MVERATEKDARKRYQDMGEMLADLEAALEVEVARAGARPARRPRSSTPCPTAGGGFSPSRTVSLAGILLVLAAFAAALIIAGVFSDDEKRGGGGGGGSTTEEPTGGEVELRQAADFDPEGDVEHPDEVGLAIDGNPSTTWPTETYNTGPIVADAGKSGVGLIVEADAPVTGTAISISTVESGWTAEIYAAAGGPPDDLAGWGAPVGTVEEAGTDEIIVLEVPSPPSRT